MCPAPRQQEKPQVPSLIVDGAMLRIVRHLSGRAVGQSVIAIGLRLRERGEARCDEQIGEDGGPRKSLVCSQEASLARAAAWPRETRALSACAPRAIS